MHRSVAAAAAVGLTGACQAADRTRWYGRSLRGDLDFRLLGPLEVREGERVLRIGGTKQRSVLAMLLLNAGDVVSADRLIDELWGASPPADAQTALHQHVSRLRKLLEPHEVIATRARGYVAEVGDDALDLHRFRRLLDRGRGELETGRPEEAAATLREALALWRGRPLADLEHEPFAREAVARLDEAWLEALTLRIEADLALGRHGELVAELQPLVRHHPLQETLRAQLMLALYRSGRHAEALEAFAAGRRLLVEELGLEPGPQLQRLQQAILNHDPALERTAPRRTTAPPQRTRRRTAAAVAAVAAGAAAVVAALALGGRETNAPAEPVLGELVALAGDGAVVRRLPVGRTPAALAAAGGALWVVDADARTVARVDIDSGAVETLATGATPVDVAAGAHGVWIANGRPLAGVQFVGPVATELLRLDTATATQRATVALPRPRGAVANRAEQRVAVTSDAVWAVTASGGVARVDPATAAIVATNARAAAIAIAAGGAGVWALRGDGTLLSLDPRTAEVRLERRLQTDSPTSLAVGRDGAWVTSSPDGMLWRVDRQGRVGGVAVGRGAADVAVTGTRVWVANAIAGAVVAVDPATMRVVRRVRVGGIPRALAVADGRLWVAVAGDAVAPAESVAGVTPLPAAVCEPVLAGAGGRADVLLVSDLPLQGGIRITALQMAQAIEFVLRERGFRAGRFRVAYQSCDDSVARTGLFDEAKCAANARAYAGNADVVAVIGTLNSPCAVAALPELNRARGGPLAMVSPLNSFVGLTRTAPGVPPELEAELYPTGRRNYLRVYPTDDLQGAALALHARARGHRSVFVLDDGEPGYGRLMAAGFGAAAERLGLRIAGRASWNPRAEAYDALARRVAASGAGAVFVGGLLDTNAAAVIRTLHARLGEEADVLGPDGLTPLPLLREQAGPAARGVFVSLGGLVLEALPPAGAAFARRFARTQPGTEIEPSAIYAAQAAHVVLEALARSDGTRGSVLRELFRVRVDDGLLGDFAFTESGDITEGPITVLRVGGGGSSRRNLSVEGGTIERIYRPETRLLAGAG